MIVEQLLKDWIAERDAAADLTVAARTPKSIAAEIEGMYQDVVARAEATALEKAQLLAEKERSLEKALDVMAKLEGQIAQMRDRGERAAAEKDRLIAEKDRAIEAGMQTVAKLEAQFTLLRERLEGRVASLEDELAERTRVLLAREDSLAQVQKELGEKSKIVEIYKGKFGAIMKAVG